MLALGLGFAFAAAAKDFTKTPLPRAETVPEAADLLLEQHIAALAPQRPGHRDLYVLAVAGDGSETVFRNEVLHLQNLARQRLDADGRVLVLANHPPESLLPPLPLARHASLRQALASLGQRMDRDQDVLLLYLNSHGTEDHRFLLRRPGHDDQLLTPRHIRSALDDAGIRHRVVVVSACYSGGFARALDEPDTLLLMAARHDRPSFGCGNDSVATYFGRAWLVDALNRSVDFETAFDQAVLDIEARESDEGRRPSLPQKRRGARIAATLADWRAGFEPGPALPYPHEEIEDTESVSASASKFISPYRPGGKSGSN